MEMGAEPHAPAPSPLLNTKLGGSQSGSRCKKREKSLAPARIEPRNPYLLSILTTLTNKHYYL